MASSSTDPGHRNFSYDVIDDFFIRHIFKDLTGYPQILDIFYLRPLLGQHAYKASLRLALPNSLQPCLEIYVSLYYVRSRP
jgi:hypothetical protein